MAGKERGGAALGDANLFRGAVWLFTDDPTWQRSPHSAELVTVSYTHLDVYKRQLLHTGAHTSSVWQHADLDYRVHCGLNSLESRV